MLRVRLVVELSSPPAQGRAFHGSSSAYLRFLSWCGILIFSRRSTGSVGAQARSVPSRAPSKATSAITWVRGSGAPDGVEGRPFGHSEGSLRPRPSLPVGEVGALGQSLVQSTAEFRRRNRGQQWEAALNLFLAMATCRVRRNTVWQLRVPLSDSDRAVGSFCHRICQQAHRRVFLMAEVSIGLRSSALALCCIAVPTGFVGRSLAVAPPPPAIQVTYNVAMAACERASEWLSALSLLRAAEAFAVRLNLRWR